MLSSWDRFEIPHPFTRALFVYGEPIFVPRRLTDDEAEAMRKTIEDRLNELADGTERDFDQLYEAAIR